MWCTGSASRPVVGRHMCRYADSGRSRCIDSLEECLEALSQFGLVKHVIKPTHNLDKLDVRVDPVFHESLGTLRNVEWPVSG